ncbi:MAG: UbiX family flavin prenyltransferase [Candidatus Njordarchaeia archaeon]
MRLVVGITGASGIIYAVRFLEYLKEKRNIEVFLIVSKGALKVIEAEVDYPVDYILSLADKHYMEDDFTAPIASGSFPVNGVVIIPASMKTVSAISVGYADNLIVRAADIALKEGRKLILVPRETPLNPIHLENMLKLAKLGAVILPACPGFYGKPETIDDLINFIVGKVLDALGIPNNLYKRWQGLNSQ